MSNQVVSLKNSTACEFEAKGPGLFSSNGFGTWIALYTRGERWSPPLLERIETMFDLMGQNSTNTLATAPIPAGAYDIAQGDDWMVEQLTRSLDLLSRLSERSIQLETRYRYGRPMDE